MMKKARFLFFNLVIINFLIFTGCKNNTNNSENTPQKTIPNLTAPEVSLKLSETDPQSTVIISWTPSDDAEYYNIRKMSIRDGVKDIQWVDSIDVDSLKNKPLSVIDKGCESDTEYFYVVSVEAASDDFIEYEDVFTKKIHSIQCYMKESEIKSIRTEKSPEITLDYP